MNITLFVIAIIWGLFAGYLLLRCADSLLGLLFCLHGLVERHWKRLADKNATGLIRPRLILKLALRLCCYALLCGFLLEAGDGFLRREYRFHYEGTTGLLFALAGGSVILSRLLVSWKRMKLVWRLAHEFDFAERRERTSLLKG
jgi:hypothetical protein